MDLIYFHRKKVAKHMEEIIEVYIYPPRILLFGILIGGGDDSSSDIRNRHKV